VSAPSAKRALRGRALVAGSARGRALVLEEPLSLWGGMDPKTGKVTDPHHPQFGADLQGRILLMPSGRGSSSSSSVLAEAVRLGSAPAAVVLLAPDPIVVLGSIVAGELYGRHVPVLTLGGPAYGSIRSGDVVQVDTEGGEAVVRADPPDASSQAGASVASRSPMSGANLNPWPLQAEPTTIRPCRSRMKRSSSVFVYMQVSARRGIGSAFG